MHRSIYEQPIQTLEGAEMKADRQRTITVLCKTGETHRKAYAKYFPHPDRPDEGVVIRAIRAADDLMMGDGGAPGELHTRSITWALFNKRPRCSRDPNVEAEWALQMTGVKPARLS